MELDILSGEDISMLSILASVIIGMFFFFNIGKYTFIRDSKFLEEYDDKDILIREAKEKIKNIRQYDYTEIATIVPFISSLVFCYCVAPFVYEKIYKRCPNLYAESDRAQLYLFVFFYLIYLLIEACFGISEKNFERRQGYVRYRRPLYGKIFIVGMIFSVGVINHAITMELRTEILSWLHIDGEKGLHISYTFLLLSYLNLLFFAKSISKGIVIIDVDVYIQQVKSRNTYFSFCGMAGSLITLVLLISCLYFSIQYEVWKGISRLDIFIFIGFLVPLCVMAGQRYCYVLITRRYCEYRKKICYLDSHGKRRQIKENLQ